jgi:hypothetical protein
MAHWPGELVIALDLLDRQLAKILVDDVAEMLEIDCERYDLHGAAAFGLIKAPAVNLAT